MEKQNESNDTQVHNDQEESTIESEKRKYEEEKKTLLEQIEELKQFVYEAELTLNSRKYADIQIKNKTELFNFDVDFQTSFSKNIIANTNLEYEMYKLAGLYCTKSVNNEFVFNVSSDRESSAVQFFVEDDKVTLGNWVMPIGITMDYILEETKLEQPIHVIPFLRNCKRHVLCHNQRKQQFDQLEKSLATITNCQITTNFGYLMITIIFYQVLSKKTNQKLNVAVNLFYNSGRVRPHTLKINSLSEELSLELRNHTKRFKKDELQDAYNSIVNRSHANFEWKPEMKAGKELMFVTTLENNEDSEDDNNQKKRKRSRKHRTTSVENINADSQNSENTSDHSEHEGNEPVTKSVPRKKLATRQPPKKLKAVKKQTSAKMIQPKPKNTEKLPTEKDLGENLQSSKLANTAGRFQKPRQTKTPKQATKRKIAAKSPEKQTNISNISLRSQQAKLNVTNSKDEKKLEAQGNSVANKKKTYTSTPMVGNMKKMKQLTLNLSPITSLTSNPANAKGRQSRRSPKKK